MKKLLAVLGLLAMLSGLVVEPASAFANGDPVTYTQSITTSANPAANFTGSSGLDTWGISIDDNKVYGIVHIDFFQSPRKIRITCNETSDGSNCAGYPLQIDGYSTTSSFPMPFIDPTNHKMWMIAQAGVSGSENLFALCIDLVDKTECETEQLNSTAITYSSKAAENFVVGDKLYAILTPFEAVVSGDAVYCYDVSEAATCADQPYPLSPTTITTGTNANFNPLTDPEDGFFRINVVEKRMVGFYGQKVICFDTVTNAQCSGSWPVSESFQRENHNYNMATGYLMDETQVASFIPHLTVNGLLDGFCYSKVFEGVWKCLDFSGSSLSTPSGLENVVSSDYQELCIDVPNYVNTGQTRNICWPNSSNEIGKQIGSRVFLNVITSNVVFSHPDYGNLSTTRGEVVCFDFAINAACVDFSKELTDMNVPYVIYRDPNNPSCLWVNGDSGDGQTQNFDAYTGGACGANGSRILFDSYIEAGSTCAPTSYGTLTINSPTSFTTSKVNFVDSIGADLGIAEQTFHNTQEIDLSSLDLPIIDGQLPQMLVELYDNNDELINEPIDMTLTWEGSYHSSCVANGQQAVASTNGGGGGNGGGGNNSGEITSDDEITVDKGDLSILQVTTDVNNPTWSITGGANKAKFKITSDGKLRFKKTVPVGDYVVKVRAKHGSTVATQNITVHVVDNGDPVVPGDEVKLGTVYFALDSWALDSAAMAKLDAYAKRIKKAGYQTVVLYGHTDNQGPAPRDVGLAKRRARQVYLYLSHTLKKVDFVRQGFSRNEPAKPNTTDKNKSLNRRVEVWAK